MPDEKNRDRLVNSGRLSHSQFESCRTGEPRSELLCRRENRFARLDPGMDLLGRVAAWHSRAAAHDPRVAWSSRALVHEVARRSVYDGGNRAVCRPLLKSVELVDDDV